MPHRASRRRRARPAALVLLATSLLFATSAPARASASDEADEHAPPVDAPIADPFRAPDGPYGSGNRGLLYDTAPGAEVHASAGGVVTFAGLVAGSRHVTVLHEGGLRTSYSFLAEIRVVAGQRVAQGDVVGTTADDLHFGARVGDAYLDPAALFADGPISVHLVPFEEPPGDGPEGERSAIRQLIGGLGGAVGALGGALGGVVGEAAVGLADTAAWLRDEGPRLARTFVHYASRLTPPIATISAIATGYRAYVRARAAADRPCTPAGTDPPPPAERRVALMVAGLGSTSESGAIDHVDTAALGYDPRDVVRSSYEGGRTPDPTDGFDTIAASSYDAASSQQDLRRAGERLADLVEDLAAAVRGVPIDIYAHSQGGLVTRLALLELEDRHGARWLERLGLVATLGTPHSGADLATAINAFGSTKAGSIALDGVAAVAGMELDDDAISAGQLSETSDLIADLAERPVPPEVRAVSIAARGDVVVPVPRTRVAGATQVVVPVSGVSAHDELPGSPEATEALALALAALPPLCQGFGSALVDQLTGEAISLGEDAVGAAAWLGAARVASPIGG